MQIIHSANDTVPEAILVTESVKAVQCNIETSPLDPHYHVIVAKEITSQKEILNNASAGLKTGGFILSEEREYQPNDSLFDKLGLVLVAVQRTSECAYALLRKVEVI